MPFFWKKKNIEQARWEPDIIELIEQRHANIDKIRSTKKDLVIDDNQINRDVLGRYLKQYKIEHDQAINGYDALKLLTDNDYDIIWTDIKMPIMNGYEFTRCLRAEYPKGFGYTGSIVGVTGFADEETQKKCIASGMNNILTKPYAQDSIIRLHSIR